MATVPKLADFSDEYQRAYKSLLPSSITKVAENSGGGGERNQALLRAMQKLIESIRKLPDGKQEAAITLLRAFDQRNHNRCFMAGYYSMLVVRNVEIALKQVA